MRPVDLLDKLIDGAVRELAGLIPVDQLQGGTIGERMDAARKLASSQVAGMSLGAFRVLMAELSKPVVTQETKTVPLAGATEATRDAGKLQAGSD